MPNFILYTCTFQTFLFSFIKNVRKIFILRWYYYTKTDTYNFFLCASSADERLWGWQCLKELEANREIQFIGCNFSLFLMGIFFTYRNVSYIIFGLYRCKSLDAEGTEFKTSIYRIHWWIRLFFSPFWIESEEIWQLKK